MPVLEAELRLRAGALALEARFALTTERCALFGPSGSGKTTLLRLLAGLARPDAGRVVLDGRVLTDTEAGVAMAAGRRGIGLLPQRAALFPHRTVEGNLLFGLHGLPRAQQADRVAAVVDLLELGGLRGRLPRALSGGEQQRVALGQALAAQPRLLLLDEPLNALGWRQKAALWQRLDRFLRERRMATLLVSHDAAEVWATAEQVVRMEEGRTTGTGTAEEMLGAERAGVLEVFRDDPGLPATASPPRAPGHQAGRAQVRGECRSG